MGKAFINLKAIILNLLLVWIFTIAKNHCIDYLRKNNLKTVSIDELTNNDEYYFEIPSKDYNPEDLMIRKQRIQLLRRLVNQLSLKYISVVKLRYFKEMSYSEISEELNLSESTIKIRLYRARKELLKIFKFDDKLVNKYFPELIDAQTEKLIILHELFETYNKINLISNNSLNNFFVEHVLHLSISKIVLQ